MFLLVTGGTIIAILVGLGMKWYLDRSESKYGISWTEFVIASIVILLVIAPLVSWLGTMAAISNQVTFNENWGGYEYGTKWVKTKTYRDGGHRWGYACDPYQVYVVDQPAYTDSDGNYHPEQGHYETRYHDCPYADEEWTFVVATTLGDYTIADRNLPTNPNQHRWRSSERIPDNLPSGVPHFWEQARDRVDSGDPGPVTARKQYENYILASQSTILQRFSDSIDKYKQDQLLPQLATGVHSFYLSDHVYLVGTTPAGNWQLQARRFNAALGVELQGDLHLVVVDAKRVTDPDNYIGALMAYWQSSAEFGKDCLSQNGIVVVVGTEDGTTIKWARAKTGMPVGNEMMLLEIQNQLPGKALNPELLFGNPKATSAGVKSDGSADVVIQHTQGVLETIIWGPHKFQRISMNGKDGVGSGYEYLKKELQPTLVQTLGILFGVVVASFAAWGTCIAVGVPTGRNIINRRNKR